MRMILVILAALIVAGGTGFYVMQGLRPAPVEAVSHEPAPTGTEVFVAARDIAVGTILTPVDLAQVAIPDAAVSPEMIVADAAGTGTVTGGVARQPLASGVPIARSAIVRPGDRGFLSAVLPKGKRAITIPVDAVGSLSGLALPGDRVDVILTYSIVSADDKEEPVRASETVLSNLRVLAFDQRLGGDPANLADKIDGAPVAKTATLEVSSHEAEVMTLAQTLGTLSLVLNSIRDESDLPEAASAAGAKLDLTASPLPGARAPRRPTRLTVASDVTSTSRVQVVRGVGSKATVPSPTADSAPAE